MTYTQEFHYDVGESAPFAEIAAFVDRARDAGATADTPVVPILVEHEDTMVDFLRVELDASATPSSTIRVPVALVRQVRDLLGDLCDGDGDVRSMFGYIKDVRRILIKVADGDSLDGTHRD